jgi:hypothetical protein
MSMIRNLTFHQLSSMLTTVFAPRSGEGALTILMDLPGGKSPDHAAWMDRRRIAAEWYTTLVQNFGAHSFPLVICCAYPNVGSNNGDLPRRVLLIDRDNGDHVPPAEGEVPLKEILEESSIVLAVTEFSATAPLKLMAREIQFRGATLPGFTRSMIPALGLDYEKVNRRVAQIKDRLDRARSATIVFSSAAKEYTLEIDLRSSEGHSSGGIIRTPGTVANLPSGEAYAVPFEGSGTKEPSQTSGILPVQFHDEVVLFRVEGNRAVAVEGNGPEASRQAEKLRNEPAYGNIAELGIGILSEWGIQPIGNPLLDEKLGLHIAFGRSDHFGGKIGPKAFRSPEHVVHIDWVYVPSLQPLIKVASVHFAYGADGVELVLKDGRLTV